MALSNFTPSGYGAMFAPMGDSASQAIPGGGGATLLVTNLGPAPAAVLLGDSTVTVSPATGVVVLAGHSLPLATGAHTHVAAYGCGLGSALNLACGS